MLGDISELKKIYIVCGYTDMRKSIDGLCAIIEDQLKMDPLSKMCIRDSLKGLLKTVLENTGKVVPVQQKWDIEHATGKDDMVKENLINVIVVFLNGRYVNAVWNVYYFILGMRQVRGRGTSKGMRG